MLRDGKSERAVDVTSSFSDVIVPSEKEGGSEESTRGAPFDETDRGRKSGGDDEGGERCQTEAGQEYVLSVIGRMEVVGPAIHFMQRGE